MTAPSDRSRRFLVAVGGLVGLVSLLIVLPLVSWVLLGGILAYLMRPVDERLSPVFDRFGEGITAGVSILLGLTVLFGPLVFLFGLAVLQARRLLADAEIEDLARLDEMLADRLGLPADLGGFDASAATEGLAGGLLGVVGGLPELFIGLTVLLFVWYHLLKDGEEAMAWLELAAPIPTEQWDELVAKTRRLLTNALLGTAVVAVVQSALLGVMFLVLSVPYSAVWTVGAFFAAMIPVVGAGLVWVPVSVYLFVVGRTGAAVALLLFGAIVVSLVDNIVRPMVMRRGTTLNPAISVVGIFGGIALFGFVGLFVGPIVLGVAKILVEVLVQDEGAAASTGDDRARPHG